MADLKELAADINTNLTDYAGKYFLQTEDIDFDGVTDWSGIGVIGNYQEAKSETYGFYWFGGIYDGQNHTILNLSTTSTANYSGILFNNFDNGELKNLTVNVNVDQNGGFGLCGGCSGSVFSNVTVTGSIKGNHHCGAFVAFGQHADAAKTFIDCTNEALVASSKSAGGFYGKPQGSAGNFIRCVNKGTIGCEGKLGGDGGLGGFCSGGQYGNYTDCVNEGVVLAGGGQFGSSLPTSVAGTMVARADQLAATGAFDGVNFADKADIVDNMATLISNDQVVVAAAAPAPAYLVMSKIATFPVAFDTVGQTIAFDKALNTAFEPTFVVDGLAVETNNVDAVYTYTAVELPPAPPFAGSGTEADPFIIACEADLNKLAELINSTTTAPDYNTAYYKQTENITMAEAFTGIGNISKQGTAADCFKGYYDGNGKEISNLIIAKRSDSNRYRGLFNSASGGAVISNLTLTITGMASDAETGEFGGGLIGFSGTSSSTIVDTTVVGCTVKGAINAAGNVGGIASRAYGTMLVKDTVVDLDITVVPNSYSGKTGGFIGHEQNRGTFGKVFENCQFTGSITVQAGGTVDGVGAFVGNGTPKSITGCSTVGAVFTFADGTPASFGQLFGTDAPSAVDGTITVNADNLALGKSKTFDGLNFATVDAGVATLISTNAFVKGNTYKVMANGVAGQVFALAAENDTISFNLELVNDAYNFTVGAAAGLKAEASAVTEHVVTFTAVKDGPTDWPTDPEDPLVKGKTADEAFPGKVPTALANVPAANFSAWAKKAGIDFANPGEINVDAYLLDCAPAKVEEEAAKFKITKIEFVNGEWVVTVTGDKTDDQDYNANAKVDIVDVTEKFDKVANGASATKGFYQAELKAITLTK